MDGLSVIGGGDTAAVVRDLGFRGDARSVISRPAAAPAWSISSGKTLPDSGSGRRWRARMPRKPLIAGNWKMNLNHVEAVGLLQKLAWTLEDKKHDADKSEVVVLPPFTDLRTVQTLVDGDRLEIGYGAQDVSAFDNGAYTGDISPTCWPNSAAAMSWSATPSADGFTVRTTTSSTRRPSRRSRVA